MPDGAGTTTPRHPRADDPRADDPRASMDAGPRAAAAAGVVYLDGAYLPRDEARVSVDDRGFLFGDGAYEVTRGAAVPRTHHFPPAGTRPTVYVAASRFVPPDELRARGASVILVPDIRWARCDLKTVNLLPNALAKQRATEAGADEAVFVRDGVVLEGAHTNVFAVLDGVLRTAPATNYILPGITRDVVLELATSLGVAAREYPLLVEELPRASELFVTSTTSDVLPVVRVDGAPVGDGAPGPVARRLMDALRARMTA